MELLTLNNHPNSLQLSTDLKEIAAHQNYLDQRRGKTSVVEAARPRTSSKHKHHKDCNQNLPTSVQRAASPVPSTSGQSDASPVGSTSGQSDASWEVLTLGQRDASQEPSTSHPTVHRSSTPDKSTQGQSISGHQLSGEGSQNLAPSGECDQTPSVSDGTMFPEAIQEMVLTQERERETNGWHQMKVTKCKLTCFSADLKKCKRELQGKREHALTLLKKKKEYYHQMIDLWHEKITVQLENACSLENQRLDEEIAAMDENVAKCEEILHESQRLFDQSDNSCHGNHINGLVTNHNKNALAQDYHGVNQICRKLQCIDKPSAHRLNFVVGSGMHLSFDVLASLHSYYTEAKGNSHASDLDRNPRTMLVSGGREILAFETRPKEFGDYLATGLSVMASGRLLVTDIGLDMVQLFTPNGTLLTDFNICPDDQPNKAVPLDNLDMIAVACKDDIKIFTPKGDFSRKINRNLRCPQGLAKDNRGNLIVTEYTNDVSKIFSYDKDNYMLINTVEGRDLEPGTAECMGSSSYLFHSPWYVTVDRDNNFLLSDLHDHTVKVVSADGKLLQTFGRQGCRPGEFFKPAGLCTDAYGSIIVADSGNDRLQIITKDGQCLTLFTSDEYELECPMDVAINNQRNLVVLQGNGDVKVFQYVS